MNIVIKKLYLAQKNKIVGDGSEFLGCQITYKYKRRVGEGAKWYPVRVLLI